MNFLFLQKNAFYCFFLANLCKHALHLSETGRNRKIIINCLRLRKEKSKGNRIKGNTFFRASSSLWDRFFQRITTIYWLAMSYCLKSPLLIDHRHHYKYQKKCPWNKKSVFEFNNWLIFMSKKENKEFNQRDWKLLLSFVSINEPLAIMNWIEKLLFLFSFNQFRICKVSEIATDMNTPDDKYAKIQIEYFFQ